MNPQQFSELIRTPDIAGAGTLKLMEDLVKRYPYCQTGQILYTLTLFKEDQLQYHSQLKKAAAYAGDRSRLKDLIESVKLRGAALPAATDAHIVQADENIAITLVEPAISDPGSEHPEISVSPEITLPQQENTFADPVALSDRLSREELLSIVRKRLAELNTDKESSSKAIPEVQKQEDQALPSKEELIDKFLIEDPKMSRPKNNFFSPTDTSLRSNLDEEEIVSETLALLYARQGNIPKAIHIYEKLSLLNQEKSRYFAAQIQQLGH